MKYQPQPLDIIAYGLLALTLTLFYFGYTHYPYGWLVLVVFIIGRSWQKHAKDTH